MNKGHHTNYAMYPVPRMFHFTFITSMPHEIVDIHVTIVSCCVCIGHIVYVVSHVCCRNVSYVIYSINII